MRKYTILLIPDTEDGGYTVRVPALPGVVTDGRTVPEAVERAKEAIELYIETLKDLGRPIPEEKEQSQALVVEVAA